MFFKWLNVGDFHSRENRLIFQLTEAANAAIGDSEDHWYYVIPGAKTVHDVLSGVGGIVSGTATLAGAAGRLAESFANLIDLGTVAIGRGLIGLEKGGVKLYNYLNDKIVGEPVFLQEYNHMAGKFSGLSPDDFIKIINIGHSRRMLSLMNSEYRMAMLDALMYQLKAFYTPAINEFAKVESEIEKRDRIKWKNDKQKKTLQERIKTRERLLKDGDLTNSTMSAILLTEKENDEKSLAQLEGETTKDVMWDMPRTQEVEFPQGSGQYRTRYLPGTKKVKVNLDLLYKNMGVYVSSFEPLLETYLKEKVKLKYWSEKVSAKSSLTSVLEDSAVDEYKKNLGQRVTQIKDSSPGEFDSLPAQPLYYLMESPFEVRRNAIGTNNVSKDYISWKMVKRIPENLKNFGCYAGYNSVHQYGIYKQAPNGKIFDFLIRQDGTISTQYPDNVIKNLPPGADLNNSMVWQTMQMPDKLRNYGCKFENGKIVKEITYSDGRKVKFTYEVQADGSIIATPDNATTPKQKLPPNADPAAPGVWKPI